MALENIDQVIEDLRSEYPGSSSEDDIFTKKTDHDSLCNNIRSIFEDLMLRILYKKYSRLDLFIFNGAKITPNKIIHRINR